jgi:hypothetical protein
VEEWSLSFLFFFLGGFLNFNYVDQPKHACVVRTSSSIARDTFLGFFLAVSQAKRMALGIGNGNACMIFCSSSMERPKAVYLAAQTVDYERVACPLGCICPPAITCGGLYMATNCLKQMRAFPRLKIFDEHPMGCVSYKHCDCGGLLMITDRLKHVRAFLAANISEAFHGLRVLTSGIFGGLQTSACADKA